MMILRYVLLALLLPAYLQGHAANKCIQGTAVTYSDAPCPAGAAANTLAEPPAPSTTQRNQATQQLTQDQHALQKLETARHKEEKHQAAIERQASKRAAARKKKCEGLALRKKWLKEDAAHATGKAVAKAQHKLQRHTEKMTLECGEHS